MFPIRSRPRLSNLVSASNANNPRTPREEKTSVRRCGRLSALAILGSLLLATSAFAQPADLFRVEPGGKVALPRNPAAAEAWRIRIDTAAFALAPKSMTLRLPTEQEITAQRSEIESRVEGNLAWRGTLPDGGHVTLTLTNGYVMGLIETKSSTWELTTHPDGSQVLIRLNPRNFGTCGNQFVHETAITSFAAPTGEPGTRAFSLGSRVSSIDVMVLYTPQARDGAGGVAAIEATAQAAIDSSNSAFINSKINTRFNLVHTALAARSDAGGADANLDWLNADPTVQALRDIYQADMVGLLLEDAGSGLCGQARLLGNADAAAFAPMGYQITRRDCAVGNLTYAHEQGHNLGLQHDPLFAASPEYAFREFAFGHFFEGVVFPEPDIRFGAFRTVMALPSSLCPGCPRRTQFSNPKVDVLGEPTGIAEERDNARTANISAPIAASWRKRFPAPAACADCIDFDSTATSSFPGEDSGVGPATALDNGATFALGGNRWQRTNQTFTITSNTVLELEFLSTVEGEIHGIGFDQDNLPNNGRRIFQLFGNQTDNTVFHNFNNYTSSQIGTFVRYTIPVGQFYTGSGFRLILVNDQDGGVRNNTSFFRNVRITTSAPPIQPQTGLWWNPNRSGNGIDFVANNAGGHVLTWFTYTASGTPIWYQSGVGPVEAGDRWQQDLFQYAPGVSGVTGTLVGSVELVFSTEGQAQFNWQLNGASGTEPFQHFLPGGGRSGLWFPPADSGWGLSVLESGTALVTTVYYYAGSQPRWTQGVGSATGGTQTIAMRTVHGLGLCPSCGGGSNQAPPASSAGTITLRIATPNAISGTLRTAISSPIGSWIRPSQAISKLAQ